MYLFNLIFVFWIFLGFRRTLAYMKKKDMGNKLILLSNLYKCFLLFTIIGTSIYLYEILS